jgi:excisionase family DNA binding protein
MKRRSSFEMVFEAALKSDAELTEEQKKQIRLVLSGDGPHEHAIDPLLLTQRQACGALGVSRFTIFRMVQDGQLHPVMIRGARRYRYEEIMEISRNGVAA